MSKGKSPAIFLDDEDITKAMGSLTVLAPSGGQKITDTDPDPGGYLQQKNSRPQNDYSLLPSQVNRSEGYNRLGDVDSTETTTTTINENPLDTERPYEETPIIDENLINQIKAYETFKPRDKFMKLRRSEFLAISGINWSVSSEYQTLSRRRLIGSIHRALKETFRNENCLVFTDNSNFQGNIRVVKRIGSDSVYGQVYLGSVALPTSSVGDQTTEMDRNPMYIEQMVAIKVMPITRPETYSDNNKEIDAMYILSDLVLKGKAMNFPVIFVDTSCERTKMPFEALPGGILARRAANFGTLERLSDVIFQVKKEQIEQSRMGFPLSFEEESQLEFSTRISLARAGFPNTSEYIRGTFQGSEKSKADIYNAILFLEKLESQFLDTNAMFAKASELLGSPYIAENLLEFNPATQIRSNIVIMELAKTDVRTLYINQQYTLKSTYDLILQVSRGLYDMQRFYRLIHNDLHTGNVLVMEDYYPEIYTFYTRYLITDFGLVSQIANDSDPMEIQNKYLKDIKYFIRILANHVRPHIKDNFQSNITFTLLKSALKLIDAMESANPREYRFDMFNFRESFIGKSKRYFGEYLKGFKDYSPRINEQKVTQDERQITTRLNDMDVPLLPRRISTSVVEVTPGGNEPEKRNSKSDEAPKRKGKTPAHLTRKKRNVPKSVKKNPSVYVKPLGNKIIGKCNTKHADKILETMVLYYERGVFDCTKGGDHDE